MISVKRWPKTERTKKGIYAMGNHMQKAKDFRIRAIFGIVSITLIIISFSIFTGIFFVRSSIETFQEADLMFIADHFTRGLVIVGLATLLLSCIAAVIASGFISRPFVEIAKSEKRFGTMLNATPLICNLWSKNYQVIDCNEEALKMFGLDKQEYMDKFLELAPEYQPDGQRTVDKARALLDIAFSEGKCVFEWMNQKLDGTLLPMEVTLTRVAYGDDYVAVGYGRDLRKQKQMMDEIDYQNSLLEAVNCVSSTLIEPDINKFESSLYKAMGVMAKAVNVNRVCIWKNHVMHNRLYCTQVYEWVKGVEPQHGNEYTVDVPYDEAVPSWEETLSKGNCINALVRKMSSPEQAQLSSQGIISILVAPVFLHDKFWGFVGFDDCRKERIFAENEELILRSAGRMIANALIRNEMTQNILDTSAQLDEAVKKANEANNAKSEFLAKMSHEIRTPLNAIVGMAELALREDMSDAAYEHNLTIRQASTSLLSIINDILDFSKIEAGNLEIIPGEYLLSSLVHNVVSIIRTRMSDSRLRFLVNIDSNIPNALLGDEIRIRQVILNLLSNAVKYTEKGFVSFSISGKTVSKSVVVLTIEIADSGRGIKEEDIRNLFRDFVQIDIEKNKGIEGTGLGLPIARSLVDAMGGEISVSSKYGFGSTFTVTLSQQIRSSEKLASVENPKEKNVLVYERREACADSILRTMDNLGVSCALVKTVAEFYEKLSDNEYPFAFVAANLYQSVKEMYPPLETNARIALVVEFGEPIFSVDFAILHTPIYSIPVANVLNGVSDRFNASYNNSPSAVRFTAPSARVLIVDDINTNLKVAEGLLLPYQMQVDLCSGGKEAIEAVKSRKYDLVFMDHRMPEMDGIEATEHIRALGVENPYFKYVPIIALTANAVSGAKEMFLENGFDDFLSKPIDTIRLDFILEKWISKEKRTCATRENNEAVAAKKLDTPKGIEIERVNVEKGILLCGGKLEDYLETLAVFLQDGFEKIDEIKMSLEAGNLPLYVTHVHALKSAAAIIGADELSGMAKDLERAGNQKDGEFIQTRNADLLSALESLTNNISKVLKKPMDLELDEN